MLSSTLHDLVAVQAERRPGATAVVMEDERLTYGELWSRSGRVACALRAAGCRAGDRVCLFMPKSPWAVTAMLGALKAGCLYVPVDVKSPAARAARIVATCEPATILAAGPTGELVGRVLAEVPGGKEIPIGWLDPAPPAGVPYTPMFDASDVALCPVGPPSPRGPEDPAHILFTSGSTGDPKGVVITHASVLRFVEWATRYFQMRPSDRVSGHSPLHFDLSTFDVYGAFASGAELHMVPPELSLLPHELAAFIRGHELTQWFSVPAALGYMARFGVIEQGDFPTLERVLWCGEVLPTPVLIHWMRRLPHVAFTNLYGPTETTIASSFHTVVSCPESEQAPISIGTPCDGESILVLDARLQHVPPGEIGDLYIGGDGLSPGYYRDPEKTDAAFVTRVAEDGRTERIYRTGDLARVGEDGLVYFIGRADTQIKCRGHRVELGEVESALSSIEGLAEHAVVAVDTGGFEGAVICCAFVAARPGGIDASKIRAELTRLLPPYMLPSRWRELAALPRNANGKVDRAALQRSFDHNEAERP